MTADRLLGVARVAEILNLSRSFTYDLIQKGEIPSLRIGRLIRIRESDLEMYVLRRKSEHQLSANALANKLRR